MGIFDDLPMMTLREAMAQDQAEMELAQRTPKEVEEILSSDWKNRSKYVMCEVGINDDYRTHIRVIESHQAGFFRSPEKFTDTNGDKWDYAIAINMDGSPMSVYDYERAR